MPDVAKMSTKGQFFWNAYGNLQAGIQSTEGYDYNRELLTYIQADDRYLSYVDEYLATATDLTEPKEDIRARAAAEHETATNVLETSPGYSTDVQGVANDFYFVIEQEYPNSAPAPAAAVETATVEAPEPETAPVVTEQVPEPVLTAMGDFSGMETPTIVTPALDQTPVVETAAPVIAERSYDESFSRTQLGELAAPPEAEFVPVTNRSPRRPCRFQFLRKSRPSLTPRP